VEGEPRAHVLSAQAADAAGVLLLGGLLHELLDEHGRSIHHQDSQESTTTDTGKASRPPAPLLYPTEAAAAAAGCLLGLEEIRTKTQIEENETDQGKGWQRERERQGRKRKGEFLSGRRAVKD